MSPAPNPQEIVDRFAKVKQEVADFINGFLANIPAEYKPTPEQIEAAIDRVLALATLGTLAATAAAIKDLGLTGKSDVTHDDSFLA